MELEENDAPTAEAEESENGTEPEENGAGDAEEGSDAEEKDDAEVTEGD